MEFDYGLLVKYLIGRLTKEELAQMMKWRSESTENENIFSDLIKLRITWKYTEYNVLDKIESALTTVNKRIDRKSSYFSLRKILTYAALLALVFSFSFYGWKQHSTSVSFVSITVGADDDIKKVYLDDGSVVWLNSGSTIQIPELFSSVNRSVKLQGEAFFEIDKNPEYPFVVITDEVSVKVLGTSFNLKTNLKEGSVETVLVSGKIALLDRDEKTVVHVSPGEKVTFNPSLNEYYVETVDVNTSTAWHLNQQTFDNATLREIVNKLAVIYDVNVNLQSKRLAERKYRCVINEEESLIEVLEILKYLAPIQYRIEGKEVFIYE